MNEYTKEMPYEGSPLQRTRQLEDRIAELEEARVADNHWIIDLQEINKNLETQLAVANERAFTNWERAVGESRLACTLEARMKEAEADAARLAAANNEINTLTFAAHMPPDYPYGLLSWINQRLYRNYIEQGKDQKHWDALTAALDARDEAEARAEAAEGALDIVERERTNFAVTCKKLAEADSARLRAALETIAAWPFDIMGDCVAEARYLAHTALRTDKQPAAK